MSYQKRYYEMNKEKRKADARAYYWKNREKVLRNVRPHQEKATAFRLKIIERLLAKQGSACAICGKVTATMVLDHDHACCLSTHPNRRCGQCERGVLCAGCNPRLGWYENNAAKIQEYLS